MNKSEAEFGKQSETRENEAQVKYFEAEANPAYGRPEDYTRDKEVE